jgi:uncharacterized membrane protein YeiH
MAQATYLRLRITDFWKGLIMAVGTAVGTAILKVLELGEFPVKWTDWKVILIAGCSALIIYLLKNLVTNTEGKMFKAEPNGGA